MLTRPFAIIVVLCAIVMIMIFGKVKKQIGSLA
jgi:Flp pilus assembly pilin Flp